MKKEKRCLKFTGYIYLPDSDADYNELRYNAARTAGRIIIFNEFNEKREDKPLAFDNVGDMLGFIERERQKRIYKRVKRQNNSMLDYSKTKTA